MLVYTAQSKQDFYCRDAVCEFVFKQGHVPLNPFRLFDYFLGDRVARDSVRAANRRVLERCDAVWVFGTTLADGVLVEVAQALRLSLPVRYFTISSVASEISEATVAQLAYEQEVGSSSGLTHDALLSWLHAEDAHRIVRAMGRGAEI